MSYKASFVVRTEEAFPFLPLWAVSGTANYLPSVDSPGDTKKGHFCPSCVRSSVVSISDFYYTSVLP